MKETYFWTKSKARLQLINSQNDQDKPFNWLFLPGGPGLGSESLHELTKILKLPGAIWHLDLPGDGSNLTLNGIEDFSHWSEALIEAVTMFDHVILVAHSTGGMYALATPKLENLLTGLILMDSAPDASWQQNFMEYVKQNPLPEVNKLQQLYAQNPNDKTLKKLTIASAPYIFTAAGLKKGILLLETLPINHKICDWSTLHFDATYQAKWIPKNIPTLILAGEEDHITPLQLFIASQDFQHHNILIKTIKNAGHYPWIENPEEVISVFEEYCKNIFLK